MKNNYNSSLVYILSLFLLIIGALIVFFKADVFSYLENYMVPETSSVVIKASGQELIDLDILEDARFKSMENQVLYFNFNRLGRLKPEGFENSNLPIFDPVYLRNSAPFGSFEE